MQQAYRGTSSRCFGWVTPTCKSMSIRSFPYASVPQLSLSRLYRVFLGIYHPFVVLVTFCLSRRLTLPHSRLATSRSPHLLNSPLNSSKNFAHREDQLGFILQTQRSPLSKTKNQTLVIGHSVFSKTLWKVIGSGQTVFISERIRAKSTECRYCL